jgi:hypothetical protein
MPRPAAAISAADPASATTRYEVIHRVRLSAVARSGSARPPVSSLRSRRVDEMANPPAISASISSDVAKNASVRLPPPWAMMSSNALLLPIRSRTSWPTEP